jgi:hypothetical protein
MKAPKIQILLSLFLLDAHSVSAQEDNFNDGDDQGWTHGDPLGGLGAGPIASFALTGGKYRISTAASPNPASAGPGRGGSFRADVIYENSFFISVDIPAYASLEQAFGVLAMVQPNPGLRATDGYSFTYQPVTNDIQITRVLNEAQELSLSNDDLLVSPGDALRLVFFGVNGVMEGRIYRLDDLSTPLQVSNGYDTTYTSGINGLVVLNNQADAAGTSDATFDNYVARKDGIPKVELVEDDGGEFLVRYPDWGLDYELLKSTSLADGSWNPLGGNQISRFDGFIHHAGEFVIEPTAFYRLRDKNILPKGAACIPNPSFEARTLLLANFPGYYDGVNPIEGWTTDTSAGLNPIYDGQSPFANNGRIPHGRRVAFIQSAGSIVHSLSTTITGLRPGLNYQVTFQANSRDGYAVPSASWSLNGGFFVPFAANPVFGENEYQIISGDFLATAETATLVIRNQTADDSAVLVDKFEISLLPIPD